MSDFLINQETNTEVFYHGSRDGIVGNIQPCSREHCDFGKGFYISTKYKLAVDIAISMHGNCPTVYELKIPEGLITKENTLFLTKEDWLYYTLYNRGKLEKIKGTDLYNYYSSLDKGKQFVVGAIVDDSYKDCLDAYLYRNLTDNGYFQIIDSFNYGIQIVAKTEEACNQLLLLKDKTYRLNQYEIEKAKRYGTQVRDEGYGKFLELFDKFEYTEGTTFKNLRQKALKGYMPKSYKSTEELMGYENIRFPDIMHEKGEDEYEPFR